MQKNEETYVAYLKTIGSSIYLAVLRGDEEVVEGQNTELRYFKRKHALAAAKKIKAADVARRNAGVERIEL